MKNRKFKYLALLPIFTMSLSLTSCLVKIDRLTFDVLVSSGYQIAPFSHWYKDTTHLLTINNLYDNQEGYSNLNYIEDTFYSNDPADVVIYDVYDGVRKIINEDLPYKLVRVVTTGNMFLMKTRNRTNKEKADPNLKSFGLQGAKVAYYTDHRDDESLATLIENVYPYKYDLVQIDNSNIAYDILLSNDGSSTQNSSKIDDVDFVFIENPLAYRATKQSEEVTFFNDGKFLNSSSLYEDVNSDIKDQIMLTGIGDSKYLGFPEKGLFISNELEQKDKEMNNFLLAFDQETSYLMTASTNSLSVMLMLGEDEAQMKRLGTNGIEMQEVQAGIKNEITGEINYNTIGYLSPESGMFNSLYMDIDETFNVFYEMDILNENNYELVFSKFYKYPEE